MLIKQVKEILIELREKPSFVWWGYQKLGAFPAAAKKPALHDINHAYPFVSTAIYWRSSMNQGSLMASMVLESISSELKLTRHTHDRSRALESSQDIRCRLHNRRKSYETGRSGRAIIQTVTFEQMCPLLTYLTCLLP